MKRKAFSLLALLSITLLAIIAIQIPMRAQAAPAHPKPRGQQAHPVHFVYPGNHIFAGTGGNLQYGGGPVMGGTTHVYAIFWEPTGSTVSANYNSLITRYFNDVGGTGLYNNNSQYTDSNNNAPTTTSFAASWVDTAAYPSSTLLDADIQNEVTNALTTNNWTASIDNIFFVFTSAGENVCFDSAQTQCSFTTFCGYHSYFSTNTIYAVIPYIGGVQGCDPSTGPNNDDADSAINVVSHEQMEAATDPLLNAWTDSSGQEIGDKCNFTFGPTAADGSDATWNNDPYIVQEEWDNAQNGCAMSGP